MKKRLLLLYSSALRVLLGVSLLSPYWLCRGKRGDQIKSCSRRSAPRLLYETLQLVYVVSCHVRTDGFVARGMSDLSSAIRTVFAEGRLSCSSLRKRCTRGYLTMASQHRGAMYRRYLVVEAVLGLPQMHTITASLNPPTYRCAEKQCMLFGDHLLEQRVFRADVRVWRVVPLSNIYSY